MKKFSNVWKAVIAIIGTLAIIGLTTYLLYLIPKQHEKLQTILTAIIAATYGGSLTLLGVVWTIKNEHKRRVEDKEEAARPFIGIINNLSSHIVEADNNFIQVCPKDWKNELKSKLTCRLINSDKSIFYIEEVIVDGRVYCPD